MAKRIKPAAIILVIIAFAVFVFAPVFINDTAFAATAEPRDWDKMAPDGELVPDATASEYVVLMDAHTGKVLYEENANEKQFPASITKIMTCLLVLENTNLDDMVKVADFKLEESKATAIGIVPGEEISVRELLYGLMLPSGNDAAIALAVHVSGSVQAFAQLMNLKAAELNMTGTHFVNPHGLHDEDHYTTAMDMAKLAFQAMKNETFREIVSTYKYTPAYTNKHNEETLWDPDIWKNTNDLVSEVYDDLYAFNDETNGHAIGIKTGHTSAAEYTLVSAAVNTDESQEVIAVVLQGTPNGRFSDSITMFMYAFEFYDTIELSEMLTDGLVIKTHVENAKDTGEQENLQMAAVPDGKAYMTNTVEKIALIKDHPELFTRKENYNVALTAPISKGQPVGTVDFYFNDEEEPVLTCSLIAVNDVEVMPEATPTTTPAPTAAAPTPKPGIGTIIKGNLGYFALGGIGLLLLIIIIIAFSGSKKKAHAARRRSSAPSASSRGRRTDTRYRDGVQRGRGRRR